jgi:hypothetical protein
VPSSFEGFFEADVMLKSGIIETFYLLIFTVDVLIFCQLTCQILNNISVGSLNPRSLASEFPMTLNGRVTPHIRFV